MPLSKSEKIDNDHAEGKIVVTASQSRFHELDDSALKDIDIRDLSLHVGKREILSHTRLVLKSGLRYAFVGRNGLGKSTVLKALAERKMPGIAPNIRMLLLDQTTIEESQKTGGTMDAKLTVIQHVVSADKVRHRMLHDANLLQEALQNGADDTDKVVRLYRKLRLEQLQRDLEAARLVQQHRSGARGARSREILLATEAAVAEAEKTLVEAPEANSAADEVDAAVIMLEGLQLNLDAMGSATVEARARTALVGLGFSPEQIDGPMSQLSGGWQTRAALAAALVQPTDILMLDEPTNFLDLPAVTWLQHYLTTELSPETTLVVTSHDRDFVDAVAERLLILRTNPAFVLETFVGTLSDYYAETSKKIKYMTRMSEALDKKKDHLASEIQKNTAAARKSGDDKKLKQAASRKKKLEERSGLEVSAKGGRFKLNRDLPGYHPTMRAGIDIPDFDPPVTLGFPEQPPELRNEATLVSLENVTFTYKKAKKATLNGINLNIMPGARIGLVGLNGSGKSTLVNLILTDFSSKSTAPGILAGNMTTHSQARIAHYTQHETTRILTLGREEPTLTALVHLQRLHPTMAEQPLRALLSGLALAPQAQAKTPMAALSGGQLVRVALAERFLPVPPHLLILDEVTTHLDSDSIVALIGALKRFEGALLVVSHDRFFVRCVVEGQTVKQASNHDGDDGSDTSESDGEDAKAGKVYRLTRTSGRMVRLERGMDEYEEVVVRQLAKQGIEV